MLEFAVDTDTCIGCAACAKMFPGIFQMAGDKAVVLAKAEAGMASSVRVAGCCPVDAIQPSSGAMTDSGRDDGGSPEPVPGWEAEWAQRKGDSTDIRERERRYGRVLELLRIDQGYILRFELPRGVPSHPLVYMYGVPQEAPDYACAVQHVGPRMLRVKARLIDPKLRFLAGKLNSFPVSFKVDYRFPEPIGAAYRCLSARGLEVYAFAEGAVDTSKRLRAAIQSPPSS